jgi:hypothetical protein
MRCRYMTHIHHTDSMLPLNCCPYGCAPDEPRCDEGRVLFGNLKSTLGDSRAQAFYRLAAREREAYWLAWNTCANLYLAHSNFGTPPIDYSLLHEGYQIQHQCSRCQETTRWVIQAVGGKPVTCCSQCHELERQEVTTLLQKIGWASDWPENGFALSIYMQVRGWIEREWLLGWRLDNRFEEWQMGFTHDSWEWMAYSRYYGIFLAEAKEPYVSPVARLALKVAQADASAVYRARLSR